MKKSNFSFRLDQDSIVSTFLFRNYYSCLLENMLKSGVDLFYSIKISTKKQCPQVFYRPLNYIHSFKSFFKPLVTVARQFAENIVAPYAQKVETWNEVIRKQTQKSLMAITG